MLAWGILAAVALQRVVEMSYASRNTAALRRAGGVEVGRGHYPLMVALHAGWLTAIAAGLGSNPVVHVIPLAAYACLQPVRLWIIATLGPFWTTRVITVPGAPLVRGGPYKYLRHPNYIVVALEIAILPLVFGQVGTAAAFAAANLALLAWRIRAEDAALASRDLHARPCGTSCPSPPFPDGGRRSPRRSRPAA
jgi:methyltransferase